MNEDYVSLEVARLLKEKGFDSHYSTHFYKNNKLECYIEDRKKYWLQKDEYAAPTLYMAQKWLRETKNIHIDVYRNAGGWLYNLTKADNGTLIAEGKSLGPNNGRSSDTYEEVLCAGILYALRRNNHEWRCQIERINQSVQRNRL